MSKIGFVRCSECNDLLLHGQAHEENGKFFCAICYANTQKPNIEKLSKTELSILKKVLDVFEKQTLLDSGMVKISGGFAVATMFNYDDTYIDIELKYGVQSDCENRVYREQYTLNRLLLNKSTSIENIAKEISA